ncbi:MAG: LysR substrate-binding domain-containing protein, partial [Pseudomonadota bacterium]
ELVPSEEIVDLRAEGIDLAIRHGRGGWPGTDPVPLASAGHVAVAAPDLLAGRAFTCVADLADLPWLLWNGRREEKDWAAEQGLDLDQVRVIGFETSTMLLQAIRGGAGVSIIPAAIVSRDIKDGRLVEVCRADDSEFAYHIIRRPGPAPKARETFIKWLRQVAQAR